MKVYVATAFKNAPEAKVIMEIVRALGHEITHDWTNEAVDPEWPADKQQEYLYRCGAADFAGVKKADLLVLVNHADSRDAMTEFGIALGSAKPVIVLYPERRSSVFFDCADTFVASTIPQFLGHLTRISGPRAYAK